jgi:hypothetical protein
MSDDDADSTLFSDFIEEDSPRAKELEEGYRAGRAGKPLSANASEEFRNGWAKGDAAADEAGNSYQLWGRLND